MRPFAKFELLETRRLLSFGAPVSDFGVSGRTSVNFSEASTADAGTREMITDSSGRVLTISDAGIARFTTTGKPDAGFGVNGVVLLNGLSAHDVAIDSSGKIVALVNGNSGTLLLRFTNAGKSDKAFGTNGAALVASSGKFASQSLAIDSSGRFVIAGNFKDSTAQSSVARVYRLTAAGAIDTSFAGDGQVELQLASPDLINPIPLDEVKNVAIGAGDSITVMGGSQQYSPYVYDPDTGQYHAATYGDAELVVARLTSSGTLDSSFGGGGYARHAYSSGVAVTYTATAGLALADGSFAITNVDASRRLVIDRFNAAGSFSREDVLSNLRFNEVPKHDLAELPGGRIAILAAVADEASGRLALLTIDPSGKFSSPIMPSDIAGKGDLISTYTDTQLITTGNSVVISGESSGLYFGEALIKVDAGDANETPNNIAGAAISDLAIDKDGGTHLAYYDSAHSSLVYQYRDRSGVWSSPRTIDSNSGAGQQLSIAVDKSDLPYIAYYDGKNGDLKLAQLTLKKKWVLTLVDSKGTTGQSPSLAINPNTNLPAISYYYKNGTTLKFATLENGAWVYESVDAKKAGQFNALVFTPKSKTPSIAYSDGAGNLKFASRAKPGKWLQSVAAASVGASYVDLAYGGYNGYGVISFFNQNTADLELAVFDGATWNTRILASTGVQGQYTHLYTPPDVSAIAVFSYNRSRDRANLYTTDYDITGTVNDSIIDSTFGRYLAVALSPTDSSFTLAGFDSTNNDLRIIDGLVPIY